MSHHLCAIVTDVAGAAALGAPATELGQGLVIVALTKQLVAELDREGARWPEWEAGSQRLVAELRARIASSFALIETEYFGGSGYQRAGAWQGERELVAPAERSGIVSEALAAVGVDKGHHLDEWEAIGLVRFRSNDDLLAR